MIINRIVNRIKNIIARSSSERYCNYLRNRGAKIGERTHIDAKNCKIDMTRPSLITIGKDCYINDYFTLLTHDYVSHVFRNMGYEFINSSGRVTIGDNVGFGTNVTILKGVTIGDNCFIGAGSIVTKDIPSNSVAVGIPCKVVMSIDEYYLKRLAVAEHEALDYAKSISERFDRLPRPEEFWEEYRYFVTDKQLDEYPLLKAKLDLNRKGKFEEYTPKYKNFLDFLKAAGIEYEK